MELPKRICEDCHKEGKVTEAVFRIVRKEVGFPSFLANTREWELCEQHLLAKSLEQFLNNWDRPNPRCVNVKWDFNTMKIERLVDAE